MIDPITETQEGLSTYQYGWNNPILRSDPDGDMPECCGGIGDFLTGVGQAINDNTGWGNPVNAQPGYVDSYNAGRTVGEYASIVIGAAGVAGGALGLGASGVITAVSAGTATPGTVVTATASIGLAAAGNKIAMSAIDNLKNNKGKVDASSSGNTGKGSNHLKPDQTAQGDHSTFRTDPQTGKTTNTATYKQNPQNPNGFQETKRVDAQGGSHRNSKTGQEIKTPHVHLPKVKDPRPASPNELPRQ